MRTIKMAHEQDNDFNQEASVREAVQSFLFSIKHLSDHTQRSYIKKLADFQEWAEQNNYNLSTLKPKQITLFTEYVTNRNNQRNGNTLSDETVKSYIRAVKTFLKWCSRDEDFEDYVTERTVSRIALGSVSIAKG